MLPQLQAEESLLMAERLAVGTGAMEKGERRRLMRSWRRAAQAAPALSARTFLASPPEALAAMGIGVRRVPRRARQETD